MKGGIDRLVLNNTNYSTWIKLDQARAAVARARELELGQYGLSVVHVSVLSYLVMKNRSLTIDEISRWNLREPHSVSTLISRMEKIGLVKKEKIPGDKKLRISLTDKGRAIHSQLTYRSIDMALSILSDEEKDQMSAYLERIRDHTCHLLGIDFKPPFLLDQE